MQDLIAFFDRCPDIFVVFLTLVITLIGFVVFPLIFEHPSTAAKRKAASGKSRAKKTQ